MDPLALTRRRISGLDESGGARGRERNRPSRTIGAVAGEVEADVSLGQNGELKLVGLAETAVKELISWI